MWQDRRGFHVELTFLGVRIVQEQQAHSSSGRIERSRLVMISIIQAICANRRRVSICLLKSLRLAAQPTLPPPLFDYHLYCSYPPYSPHPCSRHSLKMTIVLCLCWSLYPVSMCWSQSEEMSSINKCDS